MVENVRYSRKDEIDFKSSVENLEERFGGQCLCLSSSTIGREIFWFMRTG